MRLVLVQEVLGSTPRRAALYSTIGSMTYENFISGLRLFDALAASLILGVLMFRTTRHWGFYDTQQKMLVVSFASFVAATAYTSFELYAQEASIGLRSYIVLAAILITAAAFALNKKPGLMTFNEFEYKKRNIDGV